MAAFAVIEDSNIINLIECESKELAESITGALCVEYTESNPAMLGGTYDGEDFIDISPYPSWILNSETKKWKAPVAFPNDPENAYEWDENVLNWVLVP
jgi:hypothetical protein